MRNREHFATRATHTHPFPCRNSSAHSEPVASRARSCQAQDERSLTSSQSRQVSSPSLTQIEALANANTRRSFAQQTRSIRI